MPSPPAVPSSADPLAVLRDLIYGRGKDERERGYAALAQIETLIEAAEEANRMYGPLVKLSAALAAVDTRSQQP